MSSFDTNLQCEDFYSRGNDMVRVLETFDSEDLINLGLNPETDTAFIDDMILVL